MKKLFVTLLLVLTVFFSSFAATTTAILPSSDNSVRRIVFNITYKDESLKQIPCHFIIPNGEDDYWEETLIGIGSYPTLYNSPEDLNLIFNVPYYMNVKYQVTATSAEGNPVNPYINISGNQISIRLQQLIDVSNVYIVNITLSL
ncbi:MAG: hypothetical protein EGP82_04710 [Odoribacter splanchnicus]|nr:hypothetical protein [Odoribacter splanchnicus]